MNETVHITANYKNVDNEFINVYKLGLMKAHSKKSLHAYAVEAKVNSA